jgi:signal transduction histidine kinase
MLRNLRNRLLISHILPLIIIIPLTGFALVYFLETRILLPQIMNTLAGDARVIVEVTRNQTRVWKDPVYARDLLSQSNPNPNASIMLLNPDGRLLATSDTADQTNLNQIINIPGLAQARNGEIVKLINNNRGVGTETIDILAPVRNNNKQIIGIVRMTYHFNSIYGQLLQLRYLIAVILLVSLLAGAGLGLWLALNISGPIQKVTQEIYDLSYGNEGEIHVEHGVEEVQTLSMAVNFLATRLHNLEKYRQQLLANLVHELGRSLGALQTANLALLRGAERDPRLAMSLLLGMDSEIQGLQRMLEDLSQLRERVLGTIRLNLKMILLEDWLPQVLAPWQQSAKEKNLIWETIIPKHLPEIRADPYRLAQALGNLVSNAIKYTAEGGKITIESGLDSGKLWIRVADTGPGIPDEEQKDIFTPFFRGKNRGKTTDGMGLGLSIARDLVIAHNGHLDVDSHTGEGSSFTIWLPLMRSPT